VLIKFLHISNEKACENRLLIQSYAFLVFLVIPTICAVPYPVPRYSLFATVLLESVRVNKKRFRIGAVVSSVGEIVVPSVKLSAAGE
jgi:hypothetical protein